MRRGGSAREVRSRTAVLLTTRNCASRSTAGATDHTPPSEELTTISSKFAGSPRTRDAGRSRPCPLMRPRQFSQNLFFLRGEGSPVVRQRRRARALGVAGCSEAAGDAARRTSRAHVSPPAFEGLVAALAAVALHDASPTLDGVPVVAIVAPVHRPIGFFVGTAQRPALLGPLNHRDRGQEAGE